MAKVTKSVLTSAAKLRAIADRLERDAAREVAELRRLADLQDGVARVARKIAKKAKKKTAKKVARKTAKKVAKKSAKRARKALARSPLSRSHKASPTATVTASKPGRRFAATTSTGSTYLNGAGR